MTKREKILQMLEEGWDPEKIAPAIPCHRLYVQEVMRERGKKKGNKDLGAPWGTYPGEGYVSVSLSPLPCHSEWEPSFVPGVVEGRRLPFPPAD